MVSRALRQFVLILLTTFGLVLGGLAPAHAEGTVDITGLVIDSSGGGIDGLNVQAFPVDDSSTPEASDLTYANWVSGDGHGFFRLQVAPGNYLIKVSSLDGSPPYETTYYGGGTGSPVDVSTTTAHLSRITMFTPGEARATGRITDPLDAPVPGAHVTQWLWDGSDWNEGGHFDASTDGSFATGVPPDERFTYSVQHPGFQPAFLGGGTALPDVPDDSNSRPGGTTSIDVGQIVMQQLEPGLYVNVENATFGGPAANVQVSVQPQAGGAATVQTADETGAAFFGGLDPASYEVQVEPGQGFAPSGDPQLVDYAGGVEYVDLTATVDLACEPAAANDGVTNMGFEDGLEGWTLGYRTESIESVAADSFTTPWEGSAMARIGDSQPSDEEEQPEGPNVMCQDFTVTDPHEAFAFNVFTYDYTGFDELDFDVVVTEPETGETLAAYQQGAWGEGTALKTSGWRGVELDLSDHVGDTVRLTFRSGGTQDSLYAFWVYVDSAETLPPTIDMTTADIQTETGSVMTDPTTGQVTVSMPVSAPSDLTMTVPAECQNSEIAPTSVGLILNGVVFDGTSVGDGLFEVNIPAESVETGPLSLQVVCEGETTLIAPIGQIVLYDPSGIITDAVTDQPVVGAEVRLYKVPGWTPQGASGPYPDDSCQSNLSKPAEAPWDQPAPTEQGQLVNPASPEISPNVNPFVTNNVGYYGWDVAEGCWYVVVSAEGYQTLTSPVVGVPTEVTDLDLELQPLVIVNNGKPAITGTPTVGKTITAVPGSWSVDGVTFTYQWLRDGAEIASATDAAYVVDAADVAKALAVRVTATKTGYQSATATSDPVTGATAPGGGGGGGGGGTVPVPAPVNLTAPTVTGDARVGQGVSADPGSWSGSGLSYDYQWLHGGEVIEGAVSRDYVPTAADLGQQLAVRVIARRTGAPQGSATSAPVTVGLGVAPIATSLPQITGEPAVGQVLTASSGAWDAEGLAFSFQWLRDGVPIPGASSASYEVGGDDERSALAAVVTASRVGYEDGTAQTDEVAVPRTVSASVTAAHLKRDVVRPGGHGRLRVKVRSEDTRDRVVGRLVVRVDGETVRSRRLRGDDDGKARFRLPSLARGKHRIRVIYRGTRWVEPSRSDRIVLRVRRMPLQHRLPPRF